MPTQLLAYERVFNNKTVIKYVIAFVSLFGKYSQNPVFRSTIYTPIFIKRCIFNKVPFPIILMAVMRCTFYVFVKHWFIVYK